MKNIGSLDRIIRVLIVLGIFYSYYMGWIIGWVAFMLAVVSVVFLTTALTAECPLYNWLGISTKRKIN